MPRKKLEQLVKEAGLSEIELRKILRDKKPRIIKPITNYDFGSNHIKIGIASDTHIGSKYFNERAFLKSVKLFNKENVDAIYSAGDILEGMSGRDGHIYELDQIGYSAQLKRAVELLSEYKQPFHFITGNHDLWAKNKAHGGLIIGEELERRLPKAHFLGEMEATVSFRDSITMKLTHRGQTAYALCFDEETEILTENGWKLFKDLKKDERVATLNLKKDLFEWEIPTNIIKEPYCGEMFHFVARCFDLLVTPNHKLLVRIYNKKIDHGRLKELKYPTKSHQRLSKEFILKKVKELRNISRQYWQMKRGGQSWIGNLTPLIEIPKRLPKKYASNPIRHLGILKIEDICELIAWYVTEGSINKIRSQLNICQSYKINPENHGQIVHLLKRIGFNPIPRGRDMKDITVSSVELCEWLIKECDSGSRNKYLPKWLKNQPTEILKIVFETMINGDGWINGTGWGYRSISKKLRDDFTEICHKLGYGTTSYKDSISITKDQIYPTLNSPPKIINYIGKIYCVTTQNRIILVRRNGRTIWSGNSYAGQKMINSLEGGTKPSILINGNLHKSLYMFYRNIHYFEAGCLQNQTEFMAMKGSPAHVGFWILDIYFSKDGVKRLKSEWIPEYGRV